MNATSLRVLTPAKVNLILRVLERRPDGFHAIWSLMHTVGLTDEITLTMQPAAVSRIALRCDHAALAVDQSNLVYRAAQLVLARAQRSIDLSISLAKRIPMGAGLGGGSSDAAATILGLVKLLRLDWSVERMAEVGQQLGSDVPFFFVAPAACVTGRGELVSPVQVTGQRWIVLVNPGFPVETKWAYQQLATTRQGVRPLSDSLQQLGSRSVLDWAEIIPLVENDFEGPVFAQHPVLGQIKRQLVSLGAEVALLSGSGATMFGVFGDEAMAKQAALVCAADPQRKAFAVPVGGVPEMRVV
ncbi:MAG: 4-(cytidine 5'-diphospho)-2-C-methyl-D-erythritol kinase [Nitrospira sp.]|uniref:4-diphosphocytidyl-2-C-methyl-D-erythritol kinase n=1 Tax=Nitrospira defluvii TaxID=330214 RepID=A0ABN7KK24_9BACT|nr:4-(cytidine 5'-diphospho)-2-C-methyl-D-erythritol kinase [Nitrospira defluvii]MCS6326176.1 4-(cytidine 5'-diphospho)-2-C-methyl-D-erythritol kinase [Nitrospira sp.]CAE6697496.1 4-diphosphocytidyl-2-C-methyl-D-erythritol kinase [Nitrospira defluvii]